MRRAMLVTRFSCVCLCVAILGNPLPIHADAKKSSVEFNRDVRPILSDNCFQCHGPDENQRKADFRLDEEKYAFADLGGEKALVPGDPAKSILYQRLTSEQRFRRMPPAKTGKSLTPQQIAIIKQWIEEGAKWQEHWSLITPSRPEIPQVSDATLSNPVDVFLSARLKNIGLSLSPQADKRTLIRRLYFDLLGLPPTPEQVDAFVNDDSPQAYEELVDRVLASPHFGERMAIYWLDVVRFADTNGIHGDNHREIAPYRDYVINAFNENKPFDQFTIEQLAGDLLPNPTREQKIASGFNRLLMTTREGGAQAKEYRAKYAADRVRNTTSIFLGATVGCAECHDHKFDPYTQKDFYSFAAFFADIQETAVGQQSPVVLLSPEQEKEVQALDKQIQQVQAQMNRESPELDSAQEQWEQETQAKLKKDPKAKAGLPKNVAQVLEVEPGKRNKKQQQELKTYYRGIAPALKAEQQELAQLQKRKEQIRKSAPETLISVSGQPRMMRVLPRGNWLDDSGKVVEPNTPEALPPMQGVAGRATRLDLAKWLIAKENPMFARVFVNRLWKLAFGQGIVKTLDDFGSQGAWPTHLKLLDWLAVDFRENGWDVKQMMKLIVTSQAYRQSSEVTPVLQEKDPYNRLFARQSRFRLDAEMVRDNALAVSGLLVKEIGGRSVKPYQPKGYWVHLNFPKREWQKDSGADLYRRGIYTYWCRTFLHPSLLAFDAPTREECTVERPRSNTPQQALVLLNDPTYVEAARHLATRVMRETKDDVAGRVQFAYREVLQRLPRPAELQLLTQLYEHHYKEYQRETESAKDVLTVGDSPVPQDLDATKLAAWTSVTRVLLNLHETITRN